MFTSINISLLLKCFIFIPLLLYNILIIYYTSINKCKNRMNVSLKIKIHFVLYYKYYSYLCNTEKEING